MKKCLDFVLIFCLFLLLSCGTTRSGDVVVRTADNTPPSFTTPTGTSWGGTSCLNPIIDPIDGTQLILVQSMAGMGDYAVEYEKYGVKEGELLRINCTTGEVVGIVRR